MDILKFSANISRSRIFECTGESRIMREKSESKNSTEYIKQRTQELYAMLPDDEEERKSRIDIRDELIELNYKFFGYVASHTFINNTYISYEDKFQSVVLHFCEIWWLYKWKGSATKRGYRQDLSFAVFFKPRLGEMIERDLNEVKYSIRRSLCMEAGEQLGKHWSKVRYEDLVNVNLPKEKMDSLKAMFGSMYIADLEQHSNYIPAEETVYSSIHDSLTDKYNSVEDLLITEMIETEEKLNPKTLKKMSEIYSIDLDVLTAALPAAEARLYNKLQTNIGIQEEF